MMGGGAAINFGKLLERSHQTRATLRLVSAASAIENPRIGGSVRCATKAASNDSPPRH